MDKGKVDYRRLAFLFVACYILFFTLVSYLKYVSYSYKDFDLAIDANTLYNIVHGSLQCSIHRIVFLGNHMRLILFLIAPFYFIFPSPLTLLFLQSFILGAGGWVIFLITQKLLNKRWALLFCGLYLVNPLLGYMNLYEFHPTALASVFLLFCFYYFLEDNFLKFSLFMVLAMMCQENISLIFVMFAIYSFFVKKRLRWKIVPLVLGVSYFCASVLIIMPHFNKGTIQFIYFYNHLGRNWAEVLRTVVFHPFKIARILFEKSRIIFLAKLLLPLGFVSVLGIEKMFFNLPVIFQHLISSNPLYHKIIFHYQAEHLPFIFISAIYGMKRLLRLLKFRGKNVVLALFLSSFTIISIFVLGPYPKLLKNLFYGAYAKDILDIYRDKIIRKIPADAGVMASFEFLPHLVNRRYLYSFHHMYSGVYTVSTKRYTMPPQVEYILINTNDSLLKSFYSLQNYLNILPLLNSFKPYSALDSLICLSRNPQQSLEIFEVLREPPQNIQYKKDLVLGGAIRFLGFNVFETQGVYKFSFFWQCLKETDKDFNILLILYDSQGKVLYENIIRTCYLFYPTQAWPVGQYLKDNHWLIFGDTENILLELLFFDIEGKIYTSYRLKLVI